MLVYKDKTAKLKIKKIVMVDGEYTNVESELSEESLRVAISNAAVIEIFENGKSIFLNSMYVMSYEI